MTKLLLLFLFISSSTLSVVANRSFIVDYENDTFLKDGQPFSYISGTIHYFQVPHQLWQDRMERARAMGVNAIQTYVDWSKHETYQSQYNFNDSSNIVEYLQIANKLGLLVILRPGPYIDAEQDFGGFPYWLLKYPNITLRSSSDPRYLNAVENWFSVLLPMIKPLLYINGGPVIMMQVENEYGSYGCDKNYTTWLYNVMVKYLQDQVVYFTTDGREHQMLSCGSVNGTLTTIDFGVANDSQVETYFQLLRQYLPRGPLVNSEFYPGWQDEWWQASRSLQASGPVVQTMSSMWLRNASFNIYPVHGGTNWAYEAGSEYPPFKSITTEYDFDAPISEAGDVTSKFLDLKSTIETLTNRTVAYPLPSNSTKLKIDSIQLQYTGTIFDFLLTLTRPNGLNRSPYPPTMEQLDLPYGFAMYQSKIDRSGKCLSIDGVRDGAHIMIDYKLMHVVQRGYNDNVTEICPFGGLSAGSVLHLLIENQGRICYGHYINDPKGLVTNVTVDGWTISDWIVFPLDLTQFGDKILDKTLPPNGSCSSSISKYLPSFYVGYFTTTEIGDSFLNTTGWGKGQIFVNNINIGRYWPAAGPQMSLYVPGDYLSMQTSNQVVMFELDQPGNCVDDSSQCYINLSDYPIFSIRKGNENYKKRPLS